MDLNFITELFIPVVMVICLVVGVLLKKLLPMDNKFIPVILAVLGAVLACVNGGVSLETIAAGLVTGLASTGLHQVFKQLLGIDAPESTEASCIDEEEADALIDADIDNAAADKAAAEAEEQETGAEG